MFWEKSAQSIENKGREVEKERQESSRVRKRLEGKGIEEVELMKGFKRGALLGRDAGETKVRRVFTSYDRTDYRSCQYINGSSYLGIGHKAGRAQGSGDKGKIKTGTGQAKTHV